MSTVPGARVVGAANVDAYEKAATANEASNVPGRRVTGAVAPSAALPKAPPVSHYPLDELRKLLASTPSAVDRVLTAELARVEGPRKSALQALRAAEYARAEKSKTPVRSEVVDQIDTALGKKKPVAPKVEAPVSTDDHVPSETDPTEEG